MHYLVVLTVKEYHDQPLCLFCEEDRVNRLLCEKDMVLRTKVSLELLETRTRAYGSL